jgi:surface-anchored protein
MKTQLNRINRSLLVASDRESSTYPIQRRRSHVPIAYLSDFATVALLVAALCLGVNRPAQAASGPAPASQLRQVLAGVHTDAVAVFAESNTIALNTKADVNGNFDVRLNPNLTAFNLEEVTHTTVRSLPAFAFLGTAGSDVWVAPESNPGGTVLWPGFSTEDVPGGYVDGNQLTLRLDAVNGPGTLHIYQSDAFGEPIRRLTGSGAEYRDWTLNSGQHIHANWAFSATGTYTLTFIASALTNGVSISATQIYTFIIGEVPAVVATTTTLTSSTNSIVQGNSVTLNATVTPNNAVGWVEFLNGATILGHDAVAGGTATLATTNLALGTRSVTARFVPQWLNDFSASTSAPVAITVTGPGNVPFGIVGVASSYLPGETMNATIVGTNLQAGQNFRWQLRPSGSNGTGANVVSSSTSNNYSRVLSAADNGYEIRGLLRSGSAILAQTPWVPLVVGNLVQPLGIAWTSPSPAYMGDPLTASISGRSLVEGETIRIVQRTTGSWSVPDRTTITGNTVTAEPLSEPFTGEWALQVISNNVPVAQSTPIPVQWLNREIIVSGIQSVYRVGQLIQASATVYPARAGISYSWGLFNLSPFRIESFPAGTNPLTLTFERQAGLTNHNDQLSLSANWTYPDGAIANIGQGNATINVSLADPSTQLFFFNSLAAHYHQGALIGLQLVADPVLAAGDSIAWEWRWSGTDWMSFPGALGLSKVVIAEQALDGVEVRATLTFGTTNVSMVAGPATIYVDDHGAPASQQTTVAGLTNLVAGQPTTLTASVTPVSILSRYRWTIQRTKDLVPLVIAGQETATLTFTPTMTDNGASVRAALVKPNGLIAYGSSAPATLSVSASRFQTAHQYTLGHGDVRADYREGQLRIRYQVDAGAIVDGIEADPSGNAPVSFNLGELVTVLPNRPIEMPDISVDENLAWLSFIGANAGDPVWNIPETGTEAEQRETPWLGYSTEELNPADWVEAKLQVELVSISGPAGAHFSSAYNLDYGNRLAPHYATSDGITAADRYKAVVDGSQTGLWVGTHSHVNWFFTRPGRYEITLRFTGNHVTGGAKEATANLLFLVTAPTPTLALSRNFTPGLMLTCPTVVGAAYRIQSRSNLETGAWADWLRVDGTGQPLLVPVDATGTSQFFRVIIE